MKGLITLLCIFTLSKKLNAAPWDSIDILSKIPAKGTNHMPIIFQLNLFRTTED
ncbi:MAG: hypothetical protein ACLP9S_03235 [Syntrophales bacterium]